MRNYEERWVEHGQAGPIFIRYREKDLQRQVQTAKTQLRDLHNSNESTQAQLLDASQRQGEYTTGVKGRH